MQINEVIQMGGKHMSSMCEIILVSNGHIFHTQSDFKSVRQSVTYYLFQDV